MDADGAKPPESFWSRWGWALLLLAALVLFLAAWRRAGDGGAGREVGAVAYTDVSGQRHTLAELHGQVVVVDIWATWCPPCRKSLPEIAKLQAAADSRYSVVAISVDEHGFQDIAPFFQAHPELKLEAVVPAAPGDLGSLEPVGVIPTTVVVDRDGRVRARWAGYAPGRAERELKAALGR